MFTNIISKLFRLAVIIVSVPLVVVMMINTNPVSAQTALFIRDGSLANGRPAIITGNSPSFLAVLDPARISFQEVASGLTSPVFITNAGDGSGRIFVVEQAGSIRILKNGSLQATPFLDIHTLVKSGGEQGLLVLAFHPSYRTNGTFFVVYTAPRFGDATGSDLVLEKFSVSATNPDLANPNSGVILLRISHPVNSNHNGGTLAFGADGYLYWSTGDGGSAGDPPNNAQQLNNLLGKILRLDVNSGAPYGIPTSNPFYTSIDPNVKKEIWAYGLRNPWRLSFDDLTHDLYIGDVGQSTREEVDFQSANSTGGENYGWRVMEGSLCYNDPSNGCNRSGKILPVAEYTHTLGCSITGGYVYRGSNFPSLNGYYFYGDYCSGRVFSLSKDATLGWKSVQLLDTPYAISTFGEDEQGEIYLADYGTGKIFNLRYQELSFTISGNTGVAGVTLSYTDGTARTAMSLSDGSYSLQVSSNWSGTVTPSHACFTFNPGGRSYSNVTVNQTAQSYTPTLIPASGCANLNVSVNGTLMGSYGILSGTYDLASYPGVMGGPLFVDSTTGKSIVTSIRLLYNNKTLSELMGVPSSQLSDDYSMPVYIDNNSNIDSQIRFTNTSSTTSTTVQVYLGGTLMGTYPLGPSSATRVRFAGVTGGPVRIVGTPGVPILAGMRIIYGGNSSFDEMMAYPTAQLASEYWFPFYTHNNVNLMSELRIANTSSTQSSTVNVYVAGTGMGTYTLLPNTFQFVSYPGVIGGPVRVAGSLGVPIAASLRLLYNNKTYSELMGVPTSQLLDNYSMPVYVDNNGNMDSQIRFTNTSSTTSTTVQVYLGGTLMGTYPLGPSSATRVRFAGVSGGPIRIVGTPGVPILAGMRIIYGGNSSFDEIMAYPTIQLESKYWFPYYSHNQVNLDTEVRMAVP